MHMCIFEHMCDVSGCIHLITVTFNHPQVWTKEKKVLCEGFYPTITQKQSVIDSLNADGLCSNTKIWIDVKGFLKSYAIALTLESTLSPLNKQQKPEHKTKRCIF